MAKTIIHPNHAPVVRSKSTAPKITRYRLRPGFYEVREGPQWTGRLIGWLSKEQRPGQVSAPIWWTYTLAREQRHRGQEPTITDAAGKLVQLDREVRR